MINALVINLCIWWADRGADWWRLDAKCITSVIEFLKSQTVILLLPCKWFFLNSENVSIWAIKTLCQWTRHLSTVCASLTVCKWETCLCRSLHPVLCIHLSVTVHPSIHLQPSLHSPIHPSTHSCVHALSLSVVIDGCVMRCLYHLQWINKLWQRGSRGKWQVSM